jgi:hypothetical protein
LGGGSGQKIDFLLYLRNSIIVTVTTVGGQVFSVRWQPMPLLAWNFRAQQDLLPVYLQA